MCSMLLRHLLGVFTLTFLATGAFAQIQEIVPPTLSSGLPNANAAATPLSEKPEQLSAPQSVLNAASLPPIDAIGLGSDIRPFLDPGVPQSLTREALRRAWVTDPAIRDFIGLSENSWDFDLLDGVPGFGSLTTRNAAGLPLEEGDNRLLSASDKEPMAVNK